MTQNIIVKALALILCYHIVVFHRLVKSSALSQPQVIAQNTLETATKASGHESNVSLPTKNAPTLQPVARILPSRSEDLRRPIWNLAHMVNSIRELDYRLEKGANAVEADVTFSRDGQPLFTYHGPPCDCWRHCHQQENFNEYLRYINEITIQDVNGIGKNLTLLFLDLKLDYLEQRGKVRAGNELAKAIMTELFKSAPNSTHGPKPYESLRLILSVNHVTDSELIHNFLYYLEQNNASYLMRGIGFDVGMNDDIQQIESMWKRFGNQLNIWQGDGYTNCFSPFYNLERLSRALTKRNHERGYPSKVYQWTIDLHDRMREALRLGVDAIMTNHPERLLTVMREPEMAHNFRLATREDDPFMKIQSYQISAREARHRESARYQSSTSPTSGGFIGGLLDILSSWMAYMREIPFLSLPTTTRFMSRSRRPTFLDSKQDRSQVSMKTEQPEYKVDKHTGSTHTSSVSISDAIDQTLLDQSSSLTTTVPYEGPKWYISLVSSLLVSALKIILPSPP